jgi:hypothetical protein
MADTQYIFYECENPDCGLRFPGCEGHLKGNRCPVCPCSCLYGGIQKEVQAVHFS